MSFESVYALQVALDVWGIDVEDDPFVIGVVILTPNGIFDQNTIAAVRRFQELLHLPVTGEVDLSTVQHLSDALKAAGLGYLSGSWPDSLAVSLTAAGQALLQQLQPGPFPPSPTPSPSPIPVTPPEPVPTPLPMPPPVRRSSPLIAFFLSALVGSRLVRSRPEPSGAARN